MKRILHVALITAFPVLGLFSCSKDKPKQDSWKLTEPKIESPGLNPQTLSSISLQLLAGDSELVFREADMIDGKLTIVSDCQSKTASAKSKTVVASPSRIKIRNLWPQDLWLHLTNEQLKSSRCDFAFTAVNELGSQHTFNMNGIGLSDFVSRGLDSKNLESPAPITSDSSEDDLLKIAGITLNANTPNSESYVVCKEFSNTRQSNALTAFDTTEPRTPQTSVLRDLLFGKINSLKTQGSESLDPRAKATTQVCRALFVEIPNSTSTPTFTLSRDFVVNFPAPKLDVLVTSGVAGATRSSAGRISLYRVYVKNTTELWTAVRIPLNIGPSMRMQMVGRSNAIEGRESSGTALVRGSKILEEPLDYKVVGGSTRQIRGQDQIIELKPDEALTIEIGFRSNCFDWIFYDDAAATPEYRNPTAYAENGFYFDFARNFELRQMQNWNESENNLDGESNLIPTVSLKVRSGDQPNNFAALKAYDLMYDKSGREPQGELEVIAHTAPTFQLNACWFAEQGPNHL